jgi:hypothetical protein
MGAQIPPQDRPEQLGWLPGGKLTTGFGRALATLLVAGYTGLARRD